MAISNCLFSVLDSKFKNEGISLLEPKDFITDEAKMDVYQEGVNKVELSGLVKRPPRSKYLSYKGRY